MARMDPKNPSTLNLETPNGARLTIRYKGFPPGGAHVFVDPPDGGGMGINITEDQVRALEAFLHDRRPELGD